MTTTFDQAIPARGAAPGILDRERIIAAAGFNRWLVPPAALCIHLCIGMAYGFSVFWLPLSRAIGLTAPKACPEITLVQELFTTTCDWKVASLGWMFTLFFVVLGVAAAIWGGWLERVGPRKGGVVAALCWSGGLLIGAFGIYVHQLWIMWLGAGVIGGVRLRPGYIFPGPHLVQLFSRSSRHGDRHGHHGVWRRRHDRCAAGQYPDQLLQDPDLGRRLADIRGPRR